MPRISQVVARDRDHRDRHVLEIRFAPRRRDDDLFESALLRLGASPAVASGPARAARTATFNHCLFIFPPEEF